MRLLSPALLGRISRRAIVRSPHTWHATAATFALLGLSDMVLAVTGSEFDPTRLWIVGGFSAFVAAIVAVTTPPERGSLGSHLLVTAVYTGISLAVWAHAPQGSGPVITGMFIPVLIALWIADRGHAVAHLLAAWTGLLVAANSGGNEPSTVVAVVCFIPASAMMLVACSLVLDAIEAQGDALDQLALRDQLTGVGNQRMLDAELADELTRHRSSHRPLAIIEVGLDDFPALNARVGRAAGDAVLSAIARALQDRAPAGASVARCAADRFIVLLPESDEARATAYLDAVRASVPTHAGTQPLELRSGTAVYPAGGDTAEALLDAAHDARLRDPGTRARRPAAVAAAPWTVMLTAAETARLPELPRRVSRVDLSRDRLIWRVIGAALLMYVGVLSAARLLIDDLAGPAFTLVSAATVVCALLILFAPPPRMTSARNHLTIALCYLLPFAGMVAAAPNTSWVVGTGIVGPLLITTRLRSRVQILAHLLAASALYGGLALSGAPDKAGSVALGALTLNTWVLGICTAVVFEAAEAQWRDITGLLLRDPLTGVGNDELLSQRLAEELPRHEALQLPLALLDIDLNGYDELLRRDGRGPRTGRSRMPPAQSRRSSAQRRRWLDCGVRTIASCSRSPTSMISRPTAPRISSTSFAARSRASRDAAGPSSRASASPYTRTMAARRATSPTPRPLGASDSPPAGAPRSRRQRSRWMRATRLRPLRASDPSAERPSA